MKLTGKKKCRLKKIGINVGMMIVMVFYLLPFWYVINNAFKEKSFITLQPFVIYPEIFTLENILSAFEKMEYLATFFNSLIVLLLSGFLFVAIGSMTAFGIYIANHKVFQGLYIMFVSLIALPFQAAMVPLVSMLRTIHLADSFLGLALIYSAMFMPFIVFIYTGFMRSLPVELMESARMDGCSYFQVYTRIYMPLLKTVTGIVLILRGVYVWNDLQVPLIVINEPTRQTLQQRLYVFAQSRIGNFDLVFAGALLTCLPMVILFLVMQKSFIKGVMAGSVKG